MKASRAIAIVCIIVGMCFTFDKISKRILEDMQTNNDLEIINEYDKENNTDYIEENKNEYIEESNEEENGQENTDNLNEKELSKKIKINN